MVTRLLACLLRECKLGYQNLVFRDLFRTWSSLFQQEINLVKALLVGDLLAQNTLELELQEIR